MKLKMLCVFQSASRLALHSAATMQSAQNWRKIFTHPTAPSVGPVLLHHALSLRLLPGKVKVKDIDKLLNSTELSQ
jgi:hypothetical protein